MSTLTDTTHSEGARQAPRGIRRLSTETKSAFKTTEFYVVRVHLHV
jgi:hypothetical protein